MAAAAKRPQTQPMPTPAPVAPAEDQQAATTMKVKPETKSRLEVLKDVMKADSLDGVVCRLIDSLPAKLSTEQEVVLKMPVSKYRWLLAHQDSCDCRACLNEARA